jgi:hypothetical protein
MMTPLTPMHPLPDTHLSQVRHPLLQHPQEGADSLLGQWDLGGRGAVQEHLGEDKMVSKPHKHLTYTHEAHFTPVSFHRGI